MSRVLPIPGLPIRVGFHDLADAIRLRNHVLRRLEAAAAVLEPAEVERELTFVFVGAGYAGVEALGELSDLVRDALRYYPMLRDAPQHWVLVDAAPMILPEIPPLTAVYAAELLAKRGVDIRVSTTLESAEAGAVKLSDGSTIPTHTLVWTAGVRSRPAVQQFGLPLDERGRIKVDEFLRVEGRSNVWSLGDNAAVPNLATRTTRIRQEPARPTPGSQARAQPDRPAAALSIPHARPGG